MASKKYSFLTGALCLLASYGFSQTATTAGGYDASDSSIVPSRRMPQHTEFMNGTYNYPAKPRSQWEIGLKVGSANIMGDVNTQFPGLAFGAHIRKALGYAFSIRLEYMYGQARGLNWGSSTNYSYNPAWDGYTGAPVYYNHKTTLNDIALEGVLSLANIRFHKSKGNINPYIFGGLGLTTYQARVNRLNENGGFYDFTSIAQTNTYETRKETRDALKDLMDDTYETAAENDGVRRPKFFGVTATPVAHFGAGIAFKLNKTLNLAIEDRLSVSRTDLLDGQQWAEQVPGSPTFTRSHDAYNYLSTLR